MSHSSRCTDNMQMARAATKLCVHFGDDPAHGTKYTVLPYHDRYPEGDPGGETCEQHLRQLARKGVDFHFAKITSRTDHMIGVWKRDVYAGNNGAFFEEHNVRTSASHRSCLSVPD